MHSFSLVIVAVGCFVAACSCQQRPIIITPPRPIGNVRPIPIAPPYNPGSQTRPIGNVRPIPIAPPYNPRPGFGNQYPNPGFGQGGWQGGNRRPDFGGQQGGNIRPGFGGQQGGNNWG